MNDEEIKLECVRLAIRAMEWCVVSDGNTVESMAKDLYEFVSGETVE